MKTRPFLIALAATASLAACGAEKEPSKTSSTGQTEEAKNRKIMLDYARCMREHGVDMPDPTFDGAGTGPRIVTGGSDDSAPPIDVDKFNEAASACEAEGLGGGFTVSAGDGGSSGGGVRVGIAGGATK